MSVILVVNSGSSSIKYQVIQMDTEEVLAKGLVERIGSDDGKATHTGPNGTDSRELPIPDHNSGFNVMLDACTAYGPDLRELSLKAVGHRVVQGGARFVAPTVIDDDVEATIDEIGALAPLHNPPNLLGIQAARGAFPDIPHVAVFDTAFHQTMPPATYTYAIDTELAERHRIRKYGFHGTSHKYVSEKAADLLNRPLSDTNTIVLHIGNGVSACAVQGGKSVETSMGMTPLEGLVMGTRSGNIDPAVLIHLHRRAGLGFDELDDLLNRRSGLLGLAGTSDMRDVQSAAKGGDMRAQLALDVYCHRLRHYVGAYYALLGRLDAIAFTAGVGEHSATVRAMTLAGLEHMGIRLCAERNAADAREARRISTDDSAVAVLVIPTNEELEIARQTLAALAPQTA
jgi:acetate kinase